ncbi:MAG: hypothetical protein ACSHX0_12935 [Akkermansiaceae bacterium]
MILTILSALSLIALGLYGTVSWDDMPSTDSAYGPAAMLMPVFFGGAFLICLAFSKQHYRHGLYGGMIFALLGVISSIIRIYQFGHFNNLQDPKVHIILGMLAICTIQTINMWRQVQRDRIPT